MKTHIITREQLDEDNYYIGEIDLSDFDGNIEGESNLGIVKFKRSLQARGSIVFGLNSGIWAEGIIEADLGIQAGLGIRAGCEIEAGCGIQAGCEIKAGWGIQADYEIQAGCEIQAGYGIQAGWDIKAGLGIQADEGIQAGLSISCKTTLSANYGIFAGTAIWKIEEEEEDRLITCGKLIKGEIKYGTLKEVGFPIEEKPSSNTNLSEQTFKTEIDGVCYEVTIKKWNK